MSPPKHPADPRLKAYIAGESWPPASQDALESVHDRVVARTETPTGSHDLREFQRLVAAKAAADMEDKLRAAEARATRLESQIEKEREESKKFWRTLFGTVLAGLLLMIIPFVFWKLVLSK